MHRRGALSRTKEQNDCSLDEMLADARHTQLQPELTPWLTERISPASSGSGVLSLLKVKWNAAGRSTAITESVSSEEFNCVEPGHREGFFSQHDHSSESDMSWHSLIPKPCSENRVPPAKKHMPSTSTEGKHCEYSKQFSNLIGGSQRLLRIEPTTRRDGQRSGTVTHVGVAEC